MIYDSIIVGGGPAGMSAGVQLARSGFKVLLIEKNELGGLLRNAHNVENYLGSKAQSGLEFSKKFKEQLKAFLVPVLRAEVVKIGRAEAGHFSVSTSSKIYSAKTVLVASGTAPNSLDPATAELLFGKKVFYELMDFPLRGKKEKVLVVGGGDVGFDYALNLKKRGFSPTIVTKNEVVCLPVLLQRAKEKKIHVFTHCGPEEIYKKGLEAELVLIAVGRHVTMPKFGIPKRTNGLYFAGDVNHGSIRQAQIAAGEGLYAAMEITKQLKNSVHASRPRTRK